MVRNSLPYSLFLLLFLLLAGCRQNKQLNITMDMAERVMEEHPDSALALLHGDTLLVSSCPRSQQMRYHLLRVKAANKAFVPLDTEDSLMLQVVDYYDHHGTPNERMLAHYLLGCTYRDMGEAPMTLQCYMDAVNQADTTQADCDYRTMMSVYGQMASLYDKQSMPLEEMDVLEHAGKYALKCNDTVNYIRSNFLKTRAFYTIGDTAGVLRTTQDAYNSFHLIGRTKEAAEILTIAIATKLENQNYKEAHTMMEIFESKSGLFDDEGNISAQFVHYYNSKGLYYIGVCKYDSADYYFRKLLKTRFSYDAYHGLAEIFKLQNMVDSALHYYSLSENSIVDRFNDLNLASIRQTESMYNYTRNQQLAQQKQLEAQEYKTATIICLSLIVWILVAIYIALMQHRKHKQKREAEIKQQSDDLQVLSEMYSKAKDELALVQQDKEKYETEKRREIENLQQKIEASQTLLATARESYREHVYQKTKIVTAFRNITHPDLNTMGLPDEEMWNELSRVTSQLLPDFYNRITETSHLSPQEYRIALLTKLDFPNGDIALLLNTTPQRITNAKRSANQKIFNEDGAMTFSANIKSI